MFGARNHNGQTQLTSVTKDEKEKEKIGENLKHRSKKESVGDKLYFLRHAMIRLKDGLNPKRKRKH